MWHGLPNVSIVGAISTKIASSTDGVVIMAYAERSQIFGSCIASANSALPTTAAGIASYMSLGITADKLVLGQPRYGYDYPCLTLTDEFMCTIPKLPFRGVNCSVLQEPSNHITLFER